MGLEQRLQKIQAFLGVRRGNTPARKRQDLDRARLMRQAFDHALSAIVVIQIKLGNDRLPKGREARSIIIANDLQCGPLAKAAHEWLIEHGVAGVTFASLKGHFALLDEQSGLLFDVEAPHGCARKEDLAAFKREIEYGQPGANANDIIERYAQAWLDERRKIIEAESAG